MAATKITTPDKSVNSREFTVSNYNSFKKAINDNASLVDGIATQLSLFPDTYVKKTGVKTLNGKTLLGTGDLNLMDIFEAGTNITLTYNETTKKITISASGEPDPDPEPIGFTDKFTFTLAAPRMTSAGIYDKNDGVLVRTLWSGIPFETGTHTELWDGKDDFGNTLTGEFEPRVLDHNVTYTWDGVYGNTSTDQTGDEIHNTLDPIVHGRVIPTGTGKEMYYYVSGYGEGEAPEGFAYTDELQRKIVPTISHDRYGHSQTMDFLAFNSSKIFRACKDVFEDQNCYTFIIATDKTTSNLSTFSQGEQFQTVLGANYPSAIGVNKQAGYNSADISGITANDSYLYVSRKAIDRISIINAVTGALISNVTVTKPSAVCIVGSNLWCGVNSTTVTRRPINSDGTLGAVSLTLTGFSNVLDINFFGSNISVIDGGKNQQIKTYNATTGASVWIRGQLGGYIGTRSKEVFNDKFMFNRIAALYAPIVECGSIAFGSAGDYYVTDAGNQRVQHFASDGTFIDNISHEMRNYHVKINKNSDKLVQSTHRIFEIDPTKPVKQGWKLKYNFQENAVNSLDPFENFTTLSNGRMYATRILRGSPTVHQVIELVPATGIRVTKTSIPDGTYKMDYDGSIKWIVDVADGSPRGKQQWWTRPLTGFDTDGDPLWGTAVKEEEVIVPVAGPKSYSPISKDTSEKTANGNLISYDSHISSADAPNQYRLGGVKDGKFMWRSLRTVEANHKGDFPDNGEFDWANYIRDDNNNATGYYGSKVMTFGEHVIAGAHGEFWRNGQLNKYVHYHQDGLLIGVAGEQRPQFDRRGNIPYQAGNAHTPNLHYYAEDGTLNILHGTENGHQGIHRIKILNANSFNIQTGVGTTSAVRTLAGVDLLEGFTRGETLTGNKNKWTIPTPFNTSYDNKFTVAVGSRSTDRYRLSGSDLKFEFAMPSGSTRTVSCDLGTNVNLNSWSVKGLIEFDGNERNAPEGTAGHTIEVLDSAGLVIAEFYYQREPEFFKTTFRGNGAIMKTTDEDNADRDLKYQSVLDMDNLKHHRNFEVGYSGSNIVFKYADFPTLTTGIKNPSANWRNPKSLRIRFYTEGNSYVRSVGFYKLRFFNT